MSVIAPGTCRHCACTEERACRLHCGETCCWIDRERLVCSNPACIKAEAARKVAARAAAKAEAPKSRFAELAALHPTWERGAIRKEMLLEKRRSGKGRAA